MFSNHETHRRTRAWHRRHHDDSGEFGPGSGFGPGSTFGPGGPRGFSHGPGRGPGGPGGPGGRGRMGAFAREFFGPGRGAFVRRGHVRVGILMLLAEQPMHGYQIIGALSERSGGAWRPSAGSIYPTLQQLEDEGLVRGQEQDGRKVFALTDEGRTVAAEAAKQPAPWKSGGGDEAGSLFGLFMPLGNAVAEVARTGNPEMIAKAGAILTEARRSMYRLLAEDEPAE
jgi:DNA-binding PadR family transcriptional regulator